MASEKPPVVDWALRSGEHSDAGHIQSDQLPSQHDPLWYIKTNQWFCQHCLRSHPVLRKDLPSSFKNHSSCIWKKPTLRDQESCIVATNHHKFQEHHKQIIIRSIQHFDVLGYEARRYLRDLLAPARYEVLGGDPELILLIRPRVVMVQKSIRILLKQAWVYIPESRKVEMPDLEPIVICRHNAYLPRQTALRTDSLTSCMNSALLDTSDLQQRSGSCEKCRLEFTVGRWIEKDPKVARQVFINAWSDITPGEWGLENQGVEEAACSRPSMSAKMMFETCEQVFNPPQEAYLSPQEAVSKVDRIKAWLGQRGFFKARRHAIEPFNSESTRDSIYRQGPLSKLL